MHSALVEFRLSAAAEEIITAVEYAQASAVASGGRTRVSFDVASDKVLVERAVRVSPFGSFEDAELNAATVETTTFVAMENPWNRGSDYVLSSASLAWFESVDIASADFEGDTRVVFDAWGTPSSGGTVNLASERKSVALTLDPLAGRISVH
jgi:hypothetical protein